jgi:hypothetical protein
MKPFRYPDSFDSVDNNGVNGTDVLTSWKKIKL